MRVDVLDQFGGIRLIPLIQQHIHLILQGIDAKLHAVLLEHLLQVAHGILMLVNDTRLLLLPFFNLAYCTVFIIISHRKSGKDAIDYRFATECRHKLMHHLRQFRMNQAARRYTDIPIALLLEQEGNLITLAVLKNHLLIAVLQYFYPNGIQGKRL